jgi:hypothetical protein
MTNANGVDFEAIARELYYSFKTHPDDLHVVSENMLIKAFGKALAIQYERGKAEGMRASVIAKVPSFEKLQYDCENHMGYCKKLTRVEDGTPFENGYYQGAKHAYDWLLSQIGVSEVVLPMRLSAKHPLHKNAEWFDKGWNAYDDAIKAANPSLFKERE